MVDINKLRLKFLAKPLSDKIKYQEILYDDVIIMKKFTNILQENNKVNVITKIVNSIILDDVRCDRFIVKFFNQLSGTMNKTSMNVISQKDENVKELNDEEMKDLLRIDGIKFHHPLRSWENFINVTINFKIKNVKQQKKSQISIRVNYKGTKKKTVEIKYLNK